MNQSNLKTPSEFNAPKEEKKLVLKAPSLFHNADVHKCQSKKSNFEVMKKPSDFFTFSPKKKSDLGIDDSTKEERNTSVHLVKSSDSVKDNLKAKFCEQHCEEKLRKLETLLEDKELHFKQNQHERESIFKKYQHNIQQLEKRLQESEERCQLLLAEHNGKDSKHFSEVKSVYEKYIHLQNQYEHEKNVLSTKILGLEKKLGQAKSDNLNLNKILDQTRSDLLSSQTNLSTTINENKINVLRYQDQEEQLLKELKSTRISKDELVVHHNKLMNENENLKTELLEKVAHFDRFEQVVKAQEKDIVDKDEEIMSFIAESVNLKKNLVENENALKSQFLIEKERNVNLSCEIESLTQKLMDAAKISENCQYELASKLKDCGDLEKTCIALQLTNKQLNIRLDTVSEMLTLQEKSLNHSKINQRENLLDLWRQKVYQLLVLLKSKEIEEF